MTDAPATTGKPWLDLNVGKIFPWNLENALALIILALAILTRLYGLGDRVVSHDELNHFDPGYTLSQGGGFAFNPMTHGPLQMHLIALSFTFFGDSDFTARLPAALASIATVAIGLFLFRRYLGRVGALAAGFFLLISPYMLYYGRYQRNEATIVVWLLLSIYALLRYLERGEKGILILFVVANALHFTDKTTAYIYAAAQMVFLVAYFSLRIFRRPWNSRNTLIFCLSSLVLAIGLLITSAVLIPDPDPLTNQIGLICGLVGLAAVVCALLFLVQGVGVTALRKQRSLDLILLLGALILPLTAAVPMRMLGLDPQADLGAGLAAWLWIFLPAMTLFSYVIYLILPGQPGRILQAVILFVLGLAGAFIPGINQAFFVVYYLIAAAVTVGMLWSPKWWAILASIFFGIYLFLFTTFFTNINGMADGVFKFLGYWMEQQSVSRGGQPWFYFLFLQIPIYEYLPVIGAILALIAGTARALWVATPGKPFTRAALDPVTTTQPEETEDDALPVPTLALILFWTAFGLAVFTYAGEKMPQATMLLTLPMILATGWMIGYLVEAPHGPVVQSARGWILAGFAVLAFLTARTAYTAAFINYDSPVEYMAYAHGGTGPKIVLQEIERLSLLTTGGTDLVVAYDNCISYPYIWYMRHYKNKIDFRETPTADIRRAGIILTESSGSCASTKEKVDPIIKDDYVGFELTRMTWHNQDFWDLKWDFINSEYLNKQSELGITDSPPMNIQEYLGLVWGHFEPWFTDPRMRSAIFQIWLNRDFTPYAEATGRTSGYTYEDWSLADKFYVYIRKDLLKFLAGQEGGAAAEIPTIDPYTLARVELTPDQTLGGAGSETGQFLSPRGIAIAPDGSFYVADSLNHRIQHFDAGGQFLNAWGSRAGMDAGDAPGGTFNEPWGVAVGPDSSVYVADTWNHRVQKFTADGEFLTMWGAREAAEGSIAFYGPRAIAVNAQGLVFVADTGNKRIVVFGPDGEYLTQFGTAGASLGDLDEPVGIALDQDGRVFVADTWNRRVQIFTPASDGTYMPESAWDVSAWYGTLPDFKPYLALDSGMHVYISDPSTCRLLEFNERGLILALWGSCGETGDGLNNPTGLAVDSGGGIWVSDSRNNRLVHYPPPSGASGALP